MDIGKCFRDAWGLYLLDLGPLAVAAVIAGVVIAIAGAVIGLVSGAGVAVLTTGHMTGLGAGTAALAGILLFVVGLVVYAWLFAVLFRMLLGRIRQARPAGYADLQDFDQIGAFAAVTIVLGIIVGIGYALLVIPGLFLTTIWVFVLPLVADRGMGLGDAMSESQRLARQPGYMTTFVTWLVGALVVGVVAALLGLVPVLGTIVGLMTMPFAVAYVLSMYFQLTGQDNLIDAALAGR